MKIKNFFSQNIAVKKRIIDNVKLEEEIYYEIFLYDAQKNLILKSNFKNLDDEENLHYDLKSIFEDFFINIYKKNKLICYKNTAHNFFKNYLPAYVLFFGSLFLFKRNKLETFKDALKGIIPISYVALYVAFNIAWNSNLLGNLDDIINNESKHKKFEIWSLRMPIYILKFFITSYRLKNDIFNTKKKEIFEYSFSCTFFKTRIFYSKYILNKIYNLFKIYENNAFSKEKVYQSERFKKAKNNLLNFINALKNEKKELSEISYIKNSNIIIIE